MKNCLLILVLTTFLLSCKKEKTPKQLNEFFDTSQATLISQSCFSSNAHPTSGTAKLYSQGTTKTIVFENFKTDKGPDLRVYLSTTTNNNDFKELGSLKATSGNFYYNVDTTINTATYKYVLIWCEDFSVLFGSTTLK